MPTKRKDQPRRGRGRPVVPGSDLQPMPPKPLMAMRAAVKVFVGEDGQPVFEKKNRDLVELYYKLRMENFAQFMRDYKEEEKAWEVELQRRREDHIAREKAKKVVGDGVEAVDEGGVVVLELIDRMLKVAGEESGGGE